MAGRRGWGEVGGLSRKEPTSLVACWCGKAGAAGGESRRATNESFKTRWCAAGRRGWGEVGGLSRKEPTSLAARWCGKAGAVGGESRRATNESFKTRWCAAGKNQRVLWLVGVERRAPRVEREEPPTSL